MQIDLLIRYDQEFMKEKERIIELKNTSLHNIIFSKMEDSFAFSERSRRTSRGEGIRLSGPFQSIEKEEERLASVIRDIVEMLHDNSFIRTVTTVSTRTEQERR